MKAPLYEVKNKLSEYVKIAESGEPVEICKRGSPAVVMIRLEDYVQAQTQQKGESLFEKVHNAWLESCEGEHYDFSDVWDYLEKKRKQIEPARPIPFADFDEEEK